MGAHALRRSDDGGGTWSTVSNFVHVRSIDAYAGRLAVLGRRGSDTFNKIYISADHGLTWSEQTSPQERMIWAKTVAVDPCRSGQTWLSGSRSWQVFNPPTGLTNFRTHYGLAPDGSQDQLKPASDGVDNRLKYAFNMLGTGLGQATALAIPNTDTLAPAPAGSAGLPFAFRGTSGPNAGKLQITYLRRKSASNPGITYAVEFSDALASWAINPSATESTASLDATFERVSVTDSVVSSTRRFVRVSVTVP